jgi:hypothetical protein
MGLSLQVGTGENGSHSQIDEGGESMMELRIAVLAVIA